MENLVILILIISTCTFFMVLSQVLIKASKFGDVEEAYNQGVIAGRFAILTSIVTIAKEDNMSEFPLEVIESLLENTKKN